MGRSFACTTFSWMVGWMSTGKDGVCGAGAATASSFILLEPWSLPVLCSSPVLPCMCVYNPILTTYVHFPCPCEHTWACALFSVNLGYIDADKETELHCELRCNHTPGSANDAESQACGWTGSQAHPAPQVPEQSPVDSHPVSSHQHTLASWEQRAVCVWDSELATRKGDHCKSPIHGPVTAETCA